MDKTCVSNVHPQELGIQAYIIVYRVPLKYKGIHYIVDNMFYGRQDFIHIIHIGAIREAKPLQKHILPKMSTSN